MVNYKKKTAKKGRTTSNPTQTEKRTTVPSTLASPVSDHEQVPVVTSLPPAVDGHLRCFLRVCVPTIHWTVHKYPSDVQVRLKWWGEEGEGVLFRPIDDKAADQRRDSAPLTCVRYAVCSGPRQFNAYLKDMGPLIFDVVHGPSLVGQVRLADATQLSASDPIQGFFDVMSTTSPSEKLALLYITVRFESISAAYNQLSSSIPTVDTEMDSQRRRASDESDVQPTPPPLSLNPATPITHPRHASQDTDPFVSPAPQIKGVKFSSDSPERLEYTAEHTLIPAPATEETEIDTREKDDTGSMPKSELLSASSLLQTHRGAGVSSDLIGALLQRGEKLREAMVMSADEDNDLDETGGLGSVVERNTPPGKLFKAILTSHDTDGRPAVPGEDESSLIESVFLHNNKAVDLVLGEENMHYMMQSPESSPESSIVSELGDPLHDESLLTDLFYTTPAMQSDADSDHTVSTDDNDDDEQTITHACTSQGKKISRKAKQKHHSPQTIHSKDPVKMNRVSSSVGYIDPKQSSTDDTTDADHRGQHSPNKTSADSFPSTRNSRESSPNPLEFIENLGPEKLTALGRVDAARVMVDSLGINVENIKPGTYFVEYSFPTSTPAQTQEEDISMATELTRIASKKLQDGVVLFNHRSMFPALFNSTVIDYWWRRPLTFRLYFRESGQRVPAVVGIATFPLKTVLQSDTLTSSASLQIKHSKHDESSSSSSVHHLSASDDRQCASGSYGPLLVKVELMTDGKQLHVKSSRHRKPPLPTTPTKTTDRVQVAKPAQLVGQVFSGASHGTTSAVSLSDKLPSRITHKFDVTSGHDHDRDPFTLYMLLWIPDGKDLIQHGYCGNKGLVTKNNLYLVCRMFWCDEVSKSKVCWGSTDPPFGFKQVAPVLLTSSLLQRVCNNFMVIEVWNRVGSHDHGEQLVGLVKLPLHQLYLSYRDPKITKTLLKSKYPVVAVDEWCTVTNPFTHIQHGHLRVLLAMGLEEQIAAILTMKCGGDVSVGMESRPDHHLDTHSVRNKEHSENVHLTRNQEFVEHQFEITVEDIRGLSVFRSTVWGETDCFVQYHFPYQRHLQSSDSTSEAIPNLQPYRTPTTLCVPDPAFHDVARHAFKLPQGFPVQKHLLAAFTGSWVAAPSVPWSGGVPFELWRRYYYPNIRDQMVAKASLPLAKLCAMVTMQKQGEANIQTFSLPLTVLAGDEIHSMRQDRVHDTGLLDVTVKYQQVRPTQLAGGCTAQKEEDNHVCLSLEVIQACGLKAAASLHAKSNPSLSYPAEVGVNTYIVIQFPLGRKRKHVTRTVARTFSPEFSYNADILLPVVVPSDVGQKRNLSLAEQLEDSEMLFEVWHQMSRGMSSNLVITSDSQARAAREKDVLLGVGRVPLIKLLTHKTGVKGWYPIYLPSESNIRDASSCGDTEKVTGGLELCISFSEAEDRDHIIHLSRGVGWSLPPGMECDDDWLDKEELSKERHWEFCLKINKAWIPPLELHSFNSAAKKADKSVKAYARYKLYNKAPICSRISPVKDSGDGKLVCELKHSKDIMLPVTPSLAWHMKEECLEIQLWLSNRRHNADSNSRKRDRLLGSAFVDVSSLLVSQQRKNRQISGLYPLFRSGASDLLGACIHVQVSLNWCSEGGSDPEPDLEQHVSSDDSVYVGSPVEDHDTHSSTMISSQEHSAKTTQHYAKRQLPITDSDSDDTFTAHVIIDQALHLPTVPGNNGERLMPSVYVSYQTLPSVPLSCTSVVVSSTHPSWEFQKLERISYTSLKSQGLVFKVCHTSGGTLDEGVHTQEPGSAERKQDSSNGDRVIGFVSFDLSPLLAGMRQLIGWYNVTDFNGDCKGQIKLGVSPVIPVSPPRSLPSSSNLHVPSKQDGALADSSFPVNHGEPCQMMRQDGSDLRSHTDDMSHHPKGLQEDDRIGFRSHARIGITLDTDGVAETPVCSTSLLFSQLRHNMKELDTLQQNLNLKLRSGNAWNDAVLGDSSVDNPPSSSFPDRGVIATSSKTLETLRAKNTGAQGPDLGSRLSRTEFGETDFRHEVVSLDGKKISVPDDGQLLSSPHHARDLESHDQIVERTSVAKKDEEMEATNGKDIFAFDKGEVEHLQKNAEVGSFLGLQGNMSSKGATNARDIFPFDKEEQKYLQPNTEVDSFFSLGTNRSSAEDRRPSVDSELSVSDISEDLSVSGYVQDNSRTARFTDIKDSWLSSEEEEGTTENVDQSDKPGSSSFPSAFNYAEIGALDNATESQFRCREIDIHSSDHDDGGSDDGNGDKVKVLDNAVAGSKAHEENSLEGISDKVNAGSEKEAGLVNDESDGKVKSFQTDQDNEYNSYASYNKTQSRELPRQAPLSGFHDSFQLTSTALPNFFMPTEQLAESMRALRLGTSLHKANSSYSKLLARSNHLKSDPQTKGKLSERFAKREPVYKARRDERPPISNAEADRIARIFNSGSV